MTAPQLLLCVTAYMRNDIVLADCMQLCLLLALQRMQFAQNVCLAAAMVSLVSQMACACMNVPTF